VEFAHKNFLASYKKRMMYMYSNPESHCAHYSTLRVDGMTKWQKLRIRQTFCHPKIFDLPLQPSLPFPIVDYSSICSLIQLGKINQTITIGQKIKKQKLLTFLKTERILQV
jgi:hypothetical protein